VLELLALGRSARGSGCRIGDVARYGARARAEHPDEAWSSLATGGRRSRDTARSTTTSARRIGLSPSPLQRTEDVPTHVGRPLRRQ
jgi:hypothetical protein